MVLQWQNAFLATCGRRADAQAPGFNYKAGRCAELNAAADEIIARNGDISAAEIEALSDRFLSAWRRSDGGWDQVSERLAHQLEEFSRIVDEAWIPLRRSTGFSRQEGAT